MKKGGLIIILIVVISLVIGAWYYSQPKLTPEPIAKLTPPTEQKEKPIEIIVSPSPAEKENLVTVFKELFAAKFERPVSEVNISLSQEEAKHVKGSVSFVGEMGGGWFLGAKVANKWVIVDDGNGTVSCEKIAPFDFPTDMVPECWQEDTGKLIVR